MQNLAFRTTQRFNHRWERSGHLFQGRFHSVVVDVDSYLLEVVRYIHLNPVRAGLVGEPADWRWSSHLAYLGRDRDLPVDTGLVLGILGTTASQARRRFEVFVREGLDGGHRVDLDRGEYDPRVLGDARATAAILRGQGGLEDSHRPALEVVIGLVCEALSVSPGDLRGGSQLHRLTRARSLVGLLAQDRRAATLSEVSRRFRRDLTTLSGGVSRLRTRLSVDRELAALVAELSERLGAAEIENSQA